VAEYAASFSVRKFDFRDLTPLEAAARASALVGVAVELVRDGYHITRENLCGVILLTSTPIVKREESPLIKEIFARQ
jgi:hypothetical protein